MAGQGKRGGGEDNRAMKRFDAMIRNGTVNGTVTDKLVLQSYLETQNSFSRSVQLCTRITFARCESSP